jgi:hypothetical protein
MSDEAKEETKSGPEEEVWGDAELGAVLREAASQWGRETGYKKALEAWVDEKCADFEEAVGKDVGDVEHKMEYQELHNEYAVGPLEPPPAAGG